LGRALRLPIAYVADFFAGSCWFLFIDPTLPVVMIAIDFDPLAEKAWSRMAAD
jgi:hypothetical protein